MTRNEFVNDMKKYLDELTTSDLQGIVEARCLETGEDENELLEEIYKNF